MPFSRRKLLLAAGSVGLVVVGGTTAAARALSYPDGAPGRRIRLTSVDEARRLLAKLGESGDVRMAGSWSWAKVLSHCAQSVEYSLTGYPEQRVLLQRTVGPAVFSTFAEQGYMKHDLASPIPGAPELPQSDVGSAYARLVGALGAFQAHRGPLAPHFAYGPLSAAEYDLAHAMHLANHLGETINLG